MGFGLGLDQLLAFRQPRRHRWRALRCDFELHCDQEAPWQPPVQRWPSFDQVAYCSAVECDASASRSARLQGEYRVRSTHQLSSPQRVHKATRAPGSLDRPCTMLLCLLAALCQVPAVGRCLTDYGMLPQAVGAVLDAPRRVGVEPSRWRRERSIRAADMADTRGYVGSRLGPPRLLPVACAR